MSEPTGIIVGDEIGQIKRIDLLKKDCVTLKLDAHDALHPTRSVVSISPLHFDLLSSNFLIANRANKLFIYDALTDQIHKVNYHYRGGAIGGGDGALSAKSPPPLVSCQCIDDQNIVMAFKNGAIHRINIEKDLCAAAYKPNAKALNLLGIENINPPNDSNHEAKVSGKKTIRLKVSKVANGCGDDEEHQDEDDRNCSVPIYEPDWNIDCTYLTCCKVRESKVAIGGYNCDLKVLDINTGQAVFAAKSTNTDWLGVRHKLWISGIDWIETQVSSPRNLVATCSRTDACVKIYDINDRQRKPVMVVDTKSLNNANNESNAPSLTAICAAPSLVGRATPSQTLIIGTTLGRMLAFDLRLSTSPTSKVLGGFKGFGGGSIRDIKFVRDHRMSCKVFSCSIDRFVRVHDFTKTSRSICKKFYIKTKPTCVYPIIANQVAPQASSEHHHCADDEHPEAPQQQPIVEDDDDEFF